MNREAESTDSQLQPGPWVRLSFFTAYAPFLFGAIAGWMLFSRLASFPDPPGANGYFYMKQTESLANGVGFYFKDRSLAFSLSVLFYWLVGNSLLAFQLSVASTWAMLLAGVGTLSRFLAQGVVRRGSHPAIPFAIGLVAIAACMTSIPLYEFACNYFKNLFGLTLFVWSLCVFYSPLSQKLAGKALGGVLMLASLLSHKSFFLLAALLAVSFFAKDLKKNFGNRRALVPLLVGLMLAGVGAVLFVFHFERGSAYLTALVGFFQDPKPWWIWLRRLSKTEPSKVIEMAVMATAACFYFTQRRRIDAKYRVIFDSTALLILLSLQPFQTPGPNAPAYRMILLAPVLAIPLAAAVSARSVGALVAGALLFGLHFAQVAVSTRSIASYITPWSRLRTDVLQIQAYVNPVDHLTSHHGMEFFIDYLTNIRSRSFISEDEKKTAYRIAYVPNFLPPDGLARDEINQAKILDIGNDYVLLPEESWRHIQKSYMLPSHWRNPMAKRPAHIYE